jgi:hypothetical protein
MTNVLWENLFQNAGVWVGCFTRLTPDGTVVSDTPSRLTLERTSDTSARFQVCRYPDGQPPVEHQTEFATINRSSLFCTDGSFTKGSMQWSPVSDFGIEIGLTTPEARLRLVQIFQPGGALDYLVLIRETREGYTPVTRPDLSVEQLMGTWRGQAIVYTLNGVVADPVPTEQRLQTLADGRLHWSWQRGSEQGRWNGHQQGSRVLYDQQGCPYQLLLLPNGGATSCPRTIQPRTAFQCDLAWLLTPTTRLQLLRQYAADGSWSQHTWIQEEKVA